MNPISNKYSETFGASLVVVVVVLRTDTKNNPIHTGASADDIITGAPNVRSYTGAAAIYMGPQGPSYIGSAIMYQHGPVFEFCLFVCLELQTCLVVPTMVCLGHVLANYECRQCKFPGTWIL